jgi:hypothetical protein
MDLKSGYSFQSMSRKKKKKKGKRNVHKQVENGCQLVYSISSKLHQFIVAIIFLLHTPLKMQYTKEKAH